MSKFKPVRRKKSVAPSVARGFPCIVLLVAGFVLAMLFMYFVMKYSAQ
ncbi:MAG TPA: hypothetical protein VN442_13520 [Bryobacteraceae bacterium]|nr:hypothetical protein [Bryobacteraceae bacterium]